MTPLLTDSMFLARRGSVRDCTGLAPLAPRRLPASPPRPRVSSSNQITSWSQAAGLHTGGRDDGLPALLGDALESLADPSRPKAGFAAMVARVPALLAHATEELRSKKVSGSGAVGRANYSEALLMQ